MREVDDELEFHLAETVDALVAAGWTERDARREAARRFGDRPRYQRDLERIERRTYRGPAMQLDMLLFDLRYALRALRATPAFTIASLLVLVIGIGATTAIFSIVDVVVLRGLPFPDSSRLMAVGERRPNTRPGNDANGLLRMAPQNYVDVAAGQRVFASIGAMTLGSITLQENGGDPEDLSYERATASFFDVLGVKPALGRLFSAENEVEGRHFVAVLSDALWRNRFGADPGIVGRSIRLDGAAYVVAAVMPPGFTYPVGAPRPVDLWVPYFVPVNERTRVVGATAFYLQTIARLAPNVTLAEAQAQLAQMSAAFEAEYPVWNKDVKIGTRPLRDNLVGADVASWMWMLLSAAGIVLVIACANVASLFLARAASRSREMGIRVALGSNRTRIVRQLVVESLLLSSTGAALAVVLARWMVDALRTGLPALVPRTADIAVDMRVLGVIGAVSTITGLFFGCLPAIQASRPNLAGVLSGARGNIGRGRQPMRRALVVGEVALAVVLLVVAALFVGNFISVLRIDTGVKTDHVLLVQLAPKVIPGQPKPDLRAEYADVVARVAASPGVVRSAMILGGTPLGGTMSTTQLVSAGTPDKGRTVSFRHVTPDYFAALRIPLRRGRFLDNDDREGRPLVAIVNELAAKKLFPGGDAVGQPVKLDGADYTVVGVVADAIQNGFDNPLMPEAFVPIAYGARSRGDLVVYTSGNPYDALPAIKAAMRVALPDMPIRDVRTMESMEAAQLSERRLDMLLLSLFGVAGLVISAVGLYGVMAHLVSERTREIGLRIALGAPPSSVVATVVGHAGALTATGVVLGLISAWMLSSTVNAFLFRFNAADPRAFILAIGVLGSAAVVATVIPARRAARVDPLVALRSEP